jgi:hypothetical protein
MPMLIKGGSRRGNRLIRVNTPTPTQLVFLLWERKMTDATMTTSAASTASASSTTALHVGWYELHPDVSLNFQLNRWAATGGPAWIDDVRPLLPALVDYDTWRDSFVKLGERAESEGRRLHAALH